MREPFESLRETLLRAGVAPGHVRRCVRELSEHFCDLVGEGLKSGENLAEARIAARARLGDDETLADAVLAQPSLRSWTGRAPWATLVLGPILLLGLVWVPPLLACILLSGAPFHLSGTPLPPGWRSPQPSAWLRPVTETLLYLAQFGGPLLIASWVALLGARQRSRLLWPLLGCAVVALLGASLVWKAYWPAVDPRDSLGRISFSLSLGLRGRPGLRGVSVSDWSHGLPLVAFNLAVAAAVYWVARGRRLASA
jgi:hypothetical protein